MVIIRNVGGYKNVGFRSIHRNLYAIGLPERFVLMCVLLVYPLYPTYKSNSLGFCSFCRLGRAEMGNRRRDLQAVGMLTVLGKVKVKRNPTLLKRSGDRMAPATIKAHGEGKTRVFFGVRGGVGVWTSFGMREVTKTLGFATTVVFCAQLVYQRCSF